MTSFIYSRLPDIDLMHHFFSFMPFFERWLWNFKYSSICLALAIDQLSDYKSIEDYVLPKPSQLNASIV